MMVMLRLHLLLYLLSNIQSSLSSVLSPNSLINGGTGTAQRFQWNINLTQPLEIGNQISEYGEGHYAMMIVYEMHNHYWDIEILKSDCQSSPTPTFPFTLYDGNMNISSGDISYQTGTYDNINGDVNTLFIPLLYDQSAVQQSDLWVSNTAGGYVEFCVRLNSYLEPTFNTSISFHETVYSIGVDALTSFNTTFGLARRDPVEHSIGSIDYVETVQAYQCDESYMEIQNPTSVTQGEVIRICIETIEGSAFEVHSVKDITISQEGTKHFMYIKDYIESPVAETSCIASNTTSAKCVVEMQVLAWYFNALEPSDLDIEGEVKLDFLGRRHLSRTVPISIRGAKNEGNRYEDKGQVSYSRDLQNEVIERNSFSVHVPLMPTTVTESISSSAPRSQMRMSGFFSMLFTFLIGTLAML